MINELDIKEQISLIFTDALRAVDAGRAVRNAVKLINPSRLIINDEVYDLNEDQTQIYAVALGKAAYPMATALDELLGSRINGGVISGVLPEKSASIVNQNKKLSDKWRVFSGGHPLPDEASLAAARHARGLLHLANQDNALIIFMVSGGGSAMMESPVNNSISLSDLRLINRILVSCGASISEINTVRRAFSQIKGGGLSAFAPKAKQISLIVSDTEPGDEASVASGPTIQSPSNKREGAISIIRKYGLIQKIPQTILSALSNKPREISDSVERALRRRYVLLDNKSAIKAAAERATAAGFVVEVADEISQQSIEEGCAQIINRMTLIKAGTGENNTVCLISGGEFSCPVRGKGIGGRNSETALRMAFLIEESGNAGGVNSARTAFLSAGTDGIDGNSPAAGAISDDRTLERARAIGLDAREYLENSDAYTFFNTLGDTVITRPTGTNVRDLRIMLTKK